MRTKISCPFCDMAIHVTNIFHCVTHILVELSYYGSNHRLRINDHCTGLFCLLTFSSGILTVLFSFYMTVKFILNLAYTGEVAFLSI